MGILQVLLVSQCHGFIVQDRRSMLPFWPFSHPATAKPATAKPVVCRVAKERPVSYRTAGGKAVVYEAPKLPEPAPSTPSDRQAECAIDYVKNAFKHMQSQSRSDIDKKIKDRKKRLDEATTLEELEAHQKEAEKEADDVPAAQKEIAGYMKLWLGEECKDLPVGIGRTGCATALGVLHGVLTGTLPDLNAAAIFVGDGLLKMGLQALGDMLLPGVGGIVVDFSYDAARAKAKGQKTIEVIKASLSKAASLGGTAAFGALAGAVTCGNPIAIAIGGYFGGRIAAWAFTTIWDKMYPIFLQSHFYLAWERHKVTQQIMKDETKLNSYALLDLITEHAELCWAGDGFRIVTACGFTIICSGEGKWNMHDADNNLIVINGVVA